ncbi:MAG: hypothetical protein ACJ75Q_00555 [Gaiellaceae bacterium]
MANQEKRQFGAEAQRRREFKAKRAASMKAATHAALSGDGVDTTMRVRDPIFDGAADLATAKAQAAVAKGRPLKLHERREVRREELERQGSGQPAGQPQRRRPSIRERLEAMSPGERDAAVASVRDPEVRAYVAGLRDDVERLDAEAEYLVALEGEEALLAEGGPSRYWPEDSEPLTEAELQAEAGIAAATAGPLYTGDGDDVYSDDLEDGYDVDEDEEGEE